MSNVDVKPSRDWRDIARLAANEQDPQKVLTLAQELIRALDMESDRRMTSVAEERRAHSGKDAA